MKAVEFDSTLTDNGQITLPREIAAEIPAGEQLRVVVMWETAAESALHSLGRQRFEAAYSPQDEIYERLVDDSPTR